MFRPASASLLVLDKPAGPTSFDMVRLVRSRARLPKVGHAGTLDPFATGVLVVGVGSATRLLQFLSGGDKVYHLTVGFGTSTDSHDATGQVTATGRPTFSRAALEDAVRQFVGEIQQRPPSLSALRVEGERSYVRHRRGQTEDLPGRPAVIHDLQILDMTLPRVELRVRCGGGTYMRSLARDLGEALGCPAHAAALRREAVGPFTLEDAVSPAQLDAWPEGALAPAAIAREWPHLTLDDDDVLRTRQGQQPASQLRLGLGDAAQDQPVAMLDRAGNLVAVARAGSSDLRLALVIPEADGADS